MDREQAMKLMINLAERKELVPNFPWFVGAYRFSRDDCSYVEGYPEEYQDRYNQLANDFKAGIDVLCEDILKDAFLK